MDPSRLPLRPLPMEEGPIVGNQGVSVSGAVLPSLSIAYQFDDYKRRHTKQNRDIIRENAKRLVETRILQDEITELHKKLLFERAGKSAIDRELKRAQQELAKMRNTTAIEALSTILSSVPALRSLHRQLTLAPLISTSSSDPSSERDPILEWQGRPLVASAGIPDLEMVSEGNESDGMSPHGKGYGMGRRRSRTPSEEVLPRSESPPPPLSTPAFVNASFLPLKSAPSPPPRRQSPRKPVPKFVVNTEPPPARTNGRGARRQSGLFVPRMPSKSPEVEDAITRSTSTSTSTSGPTSEVIPAPTQRRRRRSEMASPEFEADVLTGGEDGIEGSQGIVEGIDGVSGTIFGKEVDEMEKVDEVGEEVRRANSESLVLPSTRGGSPTPSAVSADMDSNADPNGDGRYRRARKSVNYREPSLHTKMRKPDGTPASLSDAYVARSLEVPSLPTTGRSRSTTPLGTAATPARTTDALSELTPQPFRPESPTTKGKGADYAKSMIRPVSVGVQNKLDAVGIAGSMRRKSVVPMSKRGLGCTGEVVGGSLRAESGRESPVERGEVVVASSRRQPARRASTTIAARESAIERSAPGATSPRANRRTSPPLSSTKGLLSAGATSAATMSAPLDGSEDGLMGRKGRRRSSLFQGGSGEV